MKSEKNDGSGQSKQESDTMRSHLHQSSFSGEHDLSYFQSDVVLEGGGQHSIPAIPEGTTMSKSPMPTKSDTGSPPPNSATTAGSTSTPTSTGGMSSSGDGPMKAVEHGPEFTRGSLNMPSSGTLQASGNSSSDEHTWSVSLSEGIIAPRYATPPSNPGGDPSDASHQQSSSGRYNPTSFPSAIKLLVSNNVAGSIIGRAGQTISDLQTESSARIKLSQTGDYYPGTQDRVCLVQGQLENVKVAARLLLERLYMLQEQQHSQHLAWQPKTNDTSSPGFDFIVRLLVPSSSCGMIIGKAGSNIKDMEEASGVSSVRLSPKESTELASPSAAVVSGTSERVVTLTGPTLDSCLKCLYIVLDGMMSHHEICRYSNMTTSYSRIVVPGALGSVPSGARPGLAVPPPTGNPDASLWDSTGQYSTSQFVGNKRSNSSPDLSGQVVWDQTGAPRLPPEPPAPASSRHVGRNAMESYLFNEPSPTFSHEMQPLMHSPARGPPNISNAPSLYVLPTPSPMEANAMSNSASAPDLLAGQLQESLRLVSPPSLSPLDYQHFAPQLPQHTPPGFTAQVLVPDTLVGSILGRGGRTLNELQMHSSTRIRISQRGEYVPGTRNRIVTIRGPTAHSVSLAQYLMSQRMVLPPTASYSPQPGFHPLQPRIVQPHHSHQPRPDLQHDQFPGSHCNVFQSGDNSAQHQTNQSSKCPTRGNTGQDLTHS